MKLLTFSFFVAFELFTMSRCHHFKNAAAEKKLLKYVPLASQQNYGKNGTTGYNVKAIPRKYTPVGFKQNSRENETTDHSVKAIPRKRMPVAITQISKDNETTAYDNKTLPPNYTPDGSIEKSENEVMKLKKVPSIHMFKIDEETEHSESGLYGMNSISDEFNLIFDIKVKISNEGVLKLKTVGRQIGQHYNLTTFDIVEDVIDNYLGEIHNYFNNISKHQVSCPIEREFYILNMIESSNNILSYYLKSLCGSIMKLIEDKELHIEDINISELIQKNVIDEKITNLRHICHKLEVCRPFPAYSDKVADLLSIIAKFPEVKLKTIINIFNETAKMKQTFFKTILDDESVLQISIESKVLPENTTAARIFFRTLSHMLAGRYRMIPSMYEEFSFELKAFRILIDIVDKTFEMLEQDLIDIEFYKITNSLKDWANGGSNDVETIVMDYVNNFEHVLKHYWVQEVKKEITVLFHLLATEVHNVDIVTNGYLFIKGSKFVNGEVGVPERDTFDVLTEYNININEFNKNVL